MARTKLRGPSSIELRLATWTRFHLPRAQQWPTWSGPSQYPGYVHIGPLEGVKGWTGFQMGRNVENPEQAAYIIAWESIEDVRNFQSSPACAEFLRNLPEDDSSRASVESGSTLRSLALDEASFLSPTAISRFLILKDPQAIPRADVKGRVTMTSFSVPYKGIPGFRAYYDTLRPVFRSFLPRGSEFLEGLGDFSFQYTATWKEVIVEDHWIQQTFGELEPTQQPSQDRTIFCHFLLWSRKLDAAPEREEASAADPQAKESWIRAVERVIPPATAWKQERWDIQKLPFFYPLEQYADLEEALSMATRMITAEEYCRLHGVEAHGSPQRGRD